MNTIVFKHKFLWIGYGKIMNSTTSSYYDDAPEGDIYCYEFSVMALTEERVNKKLMKKVNYYTKKINGETEW